MTLAHATSLHFGGRRVVAKKRVAKLKDAGLIVERPRRQFDPSVLFLTRQAFQLLRDRGHCADYPALGVSAMEKRSRVSDLKLRHELAVMDIKVAVAKAIAERPTLSFRCFSTWPRLYEFWASTVMDGFQTGLAARG
jgi:hypothetical protein